MTWNYPLPQAELTFANQCELIVVAQLVLGEAEGESLNGKIAVAQVVHNRASDIAKRWSSDVRNVCLQKLQFSCFNPGSPRLKPMQDPRAHTTADVWCDCIAAATIADYHLKDLVGQSNHYHERSIRLPRWATGATPTATIGRHVFYTL